MALVFLLLLLLSLFPISHQTLSPTAGEDFTEELLLKPLPDRKVVAHLHFRSITPHSTSNGRRHHHLFPKPISHLRMNLGCLLSCYLLSCIPRSPEESTSTSSSSVRSKLRFIILVAGIAVFWQVCYG